MTSGSRIRYRALLLKYIEHVSSCEGITFLDRLNSNVSEVRFDAAEVVALRKLEDEMEAIRAAGYPVVTVSEDSPRSISMENA